MKVKSVGRDLIWNLGEVEEKKNQPIGNFGEGTELIRNRECIDRTGS